MLVPHVYANTTTKRPTDLKTQEELRPIGIRSRIGHGQNASACMLELEILVSKAASENTASAGAVATVASALRHEAFDDAVEGATAIGHALIASA